MAVFAFNKEENKLDTVIQVAKSDFEKLQKEHKQMRKALEIIRDSFWTEPSESKKHLELQDDARNVLEKINSKQSKLNNE